MMLGADVMERALTIINRIRKRYGQDPLMQAPDYWEEEFARALQQYGDERAAAAIDGILYWRKMALELKAELATARETPATAPGQNGR